MATIANLNYQLKFGAKKNGPRLAKTMSLNIAQQFMKGMVKIFWSIKISGEILNKFKSRCFLASSLSTYDFPTLDTTLPHNLIKEKLTDLNEQTFNREGSLNLACNDKKYIIYF